MKKKIVGLLLTTIMATSFVGCNSASVTTSDVSKDEDDTLSNWSKDSPSYSVAYGETTDTTTEFFDENNNVIAIQENFEYVPVDWSNETSDYSVEINE